MRLVGDGALSHPNIRRLRGAREALLSRQSGDSSVPESGLLLRSAIFFSSLPLFPTVDILPIEVTARKKNKKLNLLLTLSFNVF